MADSKKPETPKTEAQGTTPEPEAPKTVFFQMRENGSTRGRSGKAYRYQIGDVIEAPAGELDHVGSGVRILTEDPRPKP